MPEFQALAQRIKKIRKQMKETQFDFADHCGINVDTLSQIENEKTDVRLSTAQKIAAYTNLTVSQLLEVENQDNDKKEETS